ncbi:MAG: hypothetical protein KAJ06_09285 [Gammaproteobacteria bacterium]|nr:hypothetical protein [Gammaproteobacteria bacterium]
MTPELRKELDAEREWLDTGESEYLQARDTLSDPAKLRSFLMGIKAQLELVMGYDPNTQPAHAAVYVVGCARERMKGIFSDLDFVEEYQERKSRYIASIKAYATEGDGEPGLPVVPQDPTA